MLGTKCFAQETDTLRYEKPDNIGNYELMPDTDLSLSSEYFAPLTVKAFDDLIQSTVNEKEYQLNPLLSNFLSEANKIFDQKIKSSQMTFSSPAITMSGIVVPVMNQKYSYTRSEYEIFKKKNFSISIQTEIVVPSVNY
ncbi:MAG: hypothetical protein ACK5IQ_00545 [Bacteroidales bacterium]